MTPTDTPTDELRRLLDERGVEWDKGAFPNEARTYWRDVIARPWNEQRLYVTALLTPEQAIEATLGSSTCSNSERAAKDSEGDSDGRGECRNTEQFPVAWSFTCSECGVHSITEGERFNYCPNCGARLRRTDHGERGQAAGVDERPTHHHHEEDRRRPA